MLPITVYPDPLLRLVSEEIPRIDDDLKKLAHDMVESMYESNGIGLAAPQVGVSRRLVVIDIKDITDGVLYLINPKIVSKGKDKETIEEGCLSLPGLSGKVKRPMEVKVVAQDLEGNELEIEADGLLARCLQHEIDHLDGILFIDKVSMAGKLSLRGALAELEAEYQKKTGN